MLILVVIYLGPKLPIYVIKNLEYLLSTFQKNEIYFISDSVKSVKKASSIGVNTWLAPNPDEQWKDAKESLSHPMGFREGFWFKTLARIFVLNSFLELHPNVPCLQIEADVFMFANFPVSKFQELDVDIAFPMESSQMGIASLLYLKNHEVSKKLTEMALSSISVNPRITDMSLLGKVAHSKELKFLPLPTLPGEMQDALVDPEAAELVSATSMELKGVFDGISLGQYLLGIDPRNSRGVLILHRSHSSHAIDPSKLNVRLDSNGLLVLQGKSNYSYVYNLHNHAKDLRLYTPVSRQRLLQKRITSSVLGERREFILSEFLLAGFGSFKRRIRSRLRKVQV